jgi:hypothetical protein
MKPEPGERRPTLAEVLSARPMEHGHPLVLEISERHHDHKMRFAHPGTIAMLVAGSRGEAELHRIVEAVRAEDLDELERLHRQIVRHFGRALLDPSHDVRSHEDIPVFTTFRYGRKTLRRGVCTSNGLIVARSLALYDGAELDHKEFEVVHHRRADAEGGVTAVVVIRRPRLTDLERRMIRQVPAAAAEVHFGEEVGFFTGAIVGHALAHIGERAVEAAARELGIDGQINDVRQAANDIYTAAVNGAHDAAHAAAREVGVEGALDVAEAAVGAVEGAAHAVETVGEAVVDAAVDFVVDVVGAGIDWVAHNIFTVDNAEVGAQGNAGAGAGADAAGANAAGDNAGADNAANDNANDNANDDAADDNFADDGAGDDANGGDDEADKEGGSFRNWADRVDDVALELEALRPAAAVRELLGLRARMIAGQNARQQPMSLRGRAR